MEIIINLLLRAFPVKPVNKNEGMKGETGV